MSTFFVRVLIAGLYSHMLFTGLLGFGFAYFVTRRTASWVQRAGVFALFIVLAWAAHFVWNSPVARFAHEGSAGRVRPDALVVKGLPFLVLLVLLGIFARRREAQVFSQLMAEEVGGDVVTEAEFEVLRSGRTPRKFRAGASSGSKGPVARRGWPSG